jgi:hypothetical protein
VYLQTCEILCTCQFDLEAKTEDAGTTNMNLEKKRTAQIDAFHKWSLSGY